MNMSEITNAILSMNGACMGRVNKSNFIIVPTDDGGYVKVNVTAALAKDTKAHKAFNYDAAVAEYKVWETQNALKAAERAAKPPKEKGPNPEAQARRDALDAAIEALPAFDRVFLVSQMQADLSGDYKAEFLPLMRCMVKEFLVRLQGNEQRFHLIFLGRRNDPLDGTSSLIDLFKESFL